MKKNLSRITGLWEKAEGCFFDLLFPCTCLGCNAEGEFLCVQCLKQIPPQTLQVCPVCEQTITLSGELCAQCKKHSDSPLTRLIVASSYQDKLLSRTIHTYKYKFAHELSAPLGKIIEKALAGYKVPVPDLIVPVPLHPRRLRWRGFNQAGLLAEYLSINLAPNLEIPVGQNVVARVRYTGPQMKVKNYQSRFENISGAFAISNDCDTSQVRRNNILLVDDVCTTGATLAECARTLQTLGPKSITAVVLARQG